MSVTSALKKVFGESCGKVSAPDAAALAERGAILLGVREPHEWQAGHAPRARHIPLSQISRRAEQLPGGCAVVIVCRSGARSARAAALLARQGREVSSLSGGRHALARASLPVVARGGGPGRVA